MGAFYDEIPVNPDLRAWIAEQSTSNLVHEPRMAAGASRRAYSLWCGL